MTSSNTGEGRDRHVTGIPGLDDVLRGGLLSGSVYIIQGTPGAGKTIVANQVCFHAAGSGQHCLYITLLSESHDRLIENIRSLGFFNDGLIDQVQYQSGFHVLETEGLSGILHMIAEETKRYGISVVVLDGLFALQEKIDSEREFRLFINQLQNLAHLSGSTMLLLTNSDRGSGSPEYTMADGWVELGVQQYHYRICRYLQVHKLRGSEFIGGQHTLTISDAGVTILPRFESVADARCDPRRVRRRIGTGIAGVDTMIGGGIMAGSNTLVAGATGVGKTAFGLHFLSQCTASEPGLMFGFYERQADLIEKAEVLGISDFCSNLDAGNLEIVWHSPTEYMLDELGYNLVAEVRRRGVKRLFVDGVDAFRQSSLHPERLDRFFAALNDELRMEGVTTMFTLDTPELIGGGTGTPFTTLSAIAQNFLLLRYIEIGSSICKTLAIVKARTSEFDHRVREFIITNRGIEVQGPVSRPAPLDVSASKPDTAEPTRSDD